MCSTPGSVKENQNHIFQKFHTKKVLRKSAFAKLWSKNLFEWIQNLTQNDVGIILRAQIAQNWVQRSIKNLMDFGIVPGSASRGLQEQRHRARQQVVGRGWWGRGWSQVFSPTGPLRRAHAHPSSQNISDYMTLIRQSHL